MRYYVHSIANSNKSKTEYLENCFQTADFFKFNLSKRPYFELYIKKKKKRVFLVNKTKL